MNDQKIKQFKELLDTLTLQFGVVDNTFRMVIGLQSFDIKYKIMELCRLGHELSNNQKKDDQIEKFEILIRTLETINLDSLDNSLVFNQEPIKKALREIYVYFPKIKSSFSKQQSQQTSKKPNKETDLAIKCILGFLVLISIIYIIGVYVTKTEFNFIVYISIIFGSITAGGVLYKYVFKPHF